MRTGRPERLRSFDYLGIHRYFLTFCTHERRRHFVTSARVSLVHAQIVRACGDERFAILAFCFMPDHVHLLIEGLADEANCRQLIRRAKQYAGFHFKRAFRSPLWQAYGYERVLRDCEATLSVARYVIENPVRAGLVENPRDYPYVGSLRYAIDEILTAVQLDAGWYE